MTEQVEIQWTDDQPAVPGVFLPGEREPGVLLAHGAGAGQHHVLLARPRDGINAAGFPVMTFDYPYMAAGRKAPDRPPKLLACHRAAAVEMRKRVGGIVLAGRSMGGRMASHLAAEGEPCEGLILLSYPLHPPGRPEKMRVEHLPSISVPVLSLVGTRDAFVTKELYDEHLGSMPNVTTHWLEDADHSYRVRKKVTGRTQSEVIDELIAVTVNWLSGLMA